MANRKPAYTNKVNRGMRKVVAVRDAIYKTVLDQSGDLSAKDRDDIRTAIRWMDSQNTWYNNKG
tara:strand:- start:11650 stop:11841 length:192 start_codon:yes stop_codon:yes gene_type:complete